MRKAGIKQIFIKRWFDSLNGNSYFNFYAVTTKWERLESHCDCNYWYWQPESLMNYNIKENFQEKWYKYNKGIEFIDMGYGLKRDMKNI